MLMSDFEICRKVRINGGNKKYIKILSELNDCSIDHIEKILISNGFEKVKNEWKEIKGIVVKEENKRPIVEVKSHEQLNSNASSKVSSKKFFSSVKTAVQTKLVDFENSNVKVNNMRRSNMKLTDAQIKQLIKEYKSDSKLTYKDISKKYGISIWSVGQIMRNNKFKEKNSVEETVSEDISISSVEKPIEASDDKVTESSDVKITELVSVPIDLIKDLDRSVLVKMFNVVSDTIKEKKSEIESLEKFKSVLESQLIK